MRSALLLLPLLLGSLSCDGAEPTTAPASRNVMHSTKESATTAVPATTGTSASSAQKAPSTPASSPASTSSLKRTSGSTAVPSRTTPGPSLLRSTAKAPSEAPSAASSSVPQTKPSQTPAGAPAGTTQHAGSKPTSSSASLSRKATTVPPSEKPQQTTGKPIPAGSTESSAAPGGTIASPNDGSVAGTTKSPNPTNAQTARITTQPAGPAASEPKGTTAVAPTAPKDAKDTRLTTSPSPGAAPHTRTSSPKPPAATEVASSPPVRQKPSPDGTVTPTEAPAQSKIVCEKQMPSRDKVIILTLNVSTSCDGLEDTPLKALLLDLLCRAVKPSFNQSQDDCTVKMASTAENPKELAIIQTSVTTHSMNDVLSEALATKKGELEKLGVSNMTHSGRSLDAEDRFGMPLIITIVCMAALLLLVAAIYGCCHQRIAHRKEQRLTEELQTMENGYHDNPTLEVMETSSEMQEKKVNLNGELGDSWIVPMDSLTKEDLDEEEDTHL